MRTLLLVAAGLVAANLYACSTVPPSVEASEPAPEVVMEAPGEVEVEAPADTVPSPASELFEVPTDYPLETTETAPPPPVKIAETPVAVDARSQEQRYTDWKTAFTARMSAKYGAAVVEPLLADMAIRPALLVKDENQAEFVKPVWSYLDGAVSASRVRPGEENLSVFADVFDEVEARYNVEREYLTAIWGLESQYGTIMGDYPVVDSLSTFAFEGRRSEMFTTQLEALVELVAEGKLRRDDLLGGWAGAMGMTQFMPATMRDYAVDFDGDGTIDLRGNERDALGSAAHYLSRFGWVPGQPAMMEVRVPEGFDYGLADGSTKRQAEEWAAMGVLPIKPSMNGTLYPSDVAFADAKLLIPAGAKGPAFLTFKNFDVIKRYNNSTSYAMAIAGLAQTFAGEVPVRKDWPRGDQPLNTEQKEQLQTRLTALGYSTGGVDGQIGPMTRKAIRAWQRANGLPADGYVEMGLFERIMGAG